jgi:transcriptional regulator with XRE-family HTH domain
MFMKIDGFFNVLVTQPAPPNSFTRRMGELVLQARKEVGLGQSGLAEALGVSNKALAAIENGSREVSVYELVRLGRILERPLLYFLPEAYRQAVEPGLSTSEFEMLMLLGRLSETDQAKFLAQLRGLVEYLSIG